MIETHLYRTTMRTVLLLEELHYLSFAYVVPSEERFDIL